MRVQNQHQKQLHLLSHQHKEVEVRREKEPSEVGVHLGGPIDSRAKTSCAPNYFVTIGILPNVTLKQTESGCKFGNKCSFPHRKVEGQPSKKPKKGGDKNAVAFFERCATVGLCTSGHRAARILI